MRHWRRYCNIAPCRNNLGLGLSMNHVNAKNADAVKVKWWLLRHAPIEKYFDGSTTAGKFIGQTNVGCEIPETVFLQNLILRLPENALIITSDLKRTQQTADALIAAGLKIAERFIEADFAEQNFGIWEGISYDSQYQTAPEFWHDPINSRPPEGESFADLIKRTQQAVNFYCEKYPSQNIILITHAGIIRAFLAITRMKSLPALTIGQDKSLQADSQKMILNDALNLNPAPLDLYHFEITAKPESEMRFYQNMSAT